MSDELKVGYGRFDPNPQPLTPGQSKILDALKALPLATFAERREAEIATLRTQLAAMTAERDAANKQTLITEEALENACRLIPGGVLRAAGCHVSEGADTSQWFVDRAYLALEQTQ